MTKFTYEGKIKLVKTNEILHGIAGKLVNLRCAKYGDKILITYILDQTDYGTDYIPYYQDLTEDMYYAVTDIDGKTIAGPFKSTEQNQAISEDIRALKDGSLRWGYVDDNDVLKIVKVEAP